MNLNETTNKELQKRAVVVLIKAIFDQLHEVNSLRAKRKPAGLSILLLREMCSILPELDAELQAYYFSVLPELIGKGTVTRPEVDEIYVEQSQAAKERFLTKIRLELAA